MVTVKCTDIYGKLKYTLMPFLLKSACSVFKYICNYTFVMIKMQNIKYINFFNKIVIKYFTCALAC